MGGYVAQEFLLRHPKTARRLILAGTAPRAGVPTEDPQVVPVATRHAVPTLEDFLYLFFAPTETSQAAGRAFWERRHQRKQDLDPPTSNQTMLAQASAFTAYRTPKGEPFAALRGSTHPTLVVNGCEDRMVPTINSYNLAKNLPNGQLIIYPDSGHGALFQFADLFVAHASMFLDRTDS